MWRRVELVGFAVLLLCGLVNIPLLVALKMLLKKCA